MANLGLEWDDVHAANPPASMVRMPAFGLDGPWRDRVGFAQTMEQASGMAWMTGGPDGPPSYRAVRATRSRDCTRRSPPSPHWRSATGPAGACSRVDDGRGGAERRGRGDRRIRRLRQGRHPRRQPRAGGQPAGGVPLRGRRSWLALAVTDDAQWERLTAVLGNPEALRRPGLADIAGRSSQADLIDEAISRWSASLLASEAAGALRAAGIPAAAVNGPAQLLADEQLAHRQFWETVSHPVAGTIRVPGMPFRYASLDEPWTRAAAPTLGQHNHEILTGLVGISDDAVRELESKSIIGARPEGM